MVSMVPPTSSPRLPSFTLCHPRFVSQGELDKAESLFEQAYKIRVKTYGMNHPETATSLAWLAEMKKARVSGSML